MTRSYISDKEAIAQHIQELLVSYEATLEETYNCTIKNDDIVFHGTDEFYKEHLQSIIDHQEDKFHEQAITAFHQKNSPHL